MTRQNATLSRLIPFANYQVSVKCIPLVELVEHDMNSFAARGCWSKAVYAMFTTQPDGRFIVMKHCMR